MFILLSTINQKEQILVKTTRLQLSNSSIPHESYLGV